MRDATPLKRFSPCACVRGTAKKRHGSSPPSKSAPVLRASRSLLSRRKVEPRYLCTCTVRCDTVVLTPKGDSDEGTRTMSTYAERFLTAFSVITPKGERVTFDFHRRDAPHWVSGQGQGRGGMSGSHKDYRKKPRMYVGCEETLLENLVNRTTRPVNAWGRTIRDAMKIAGLEGQIGWYQRAGCSCPCSPGFIWTNAPYVENYSTYDVGVHIAGAPVARDDAHAENVQFERLGQLTEDPTLSIEMLGTTR